MASQLFHSSHIYSCSNVKGTSDLPLSHNLMNPLLTTLLGPSSRHSASSQSLYISHTHTPKWCYLEQLSCHETERPSCPQHLTSSTTSVTVLTTALHYGLKSNAFAFWHCFTICYLTSRNTSRYVSSLVIMVSLTLRNYSVHLPCHFSHPEDILPDSLQFTWHLTFLSLA